MNSPTTYPIPPKTMATLEGLLNQQRMLQGQIEAIVATVKDILEVPDGYVIRSLGVGFEPPAEVPEEPTPDLAE